MPSPRVAACTSRPLLVGERDGEPVDLGLGRQLDDGSAGSPRKRRTRAMKSTTSSSVKALPSESIGTAWRTLPKASTGAAPTRLEGLSGAHDARESAPRSRHCAGAARRSRRRRSRAHPARSRARRDGRSRAASRSSSAFASASVSLSTGLLDAVVAFMRARLPPPDERNPDPSCGLRGCHCFARARAAAWTARSRPARRSALRGAGISSGDGMPGDGARRRRGFRLLRLRPRRDRLEGVAEPGALVQLRAHAAGLAGARRRACTTRNSGSCGRARPPPLCASGTIPSAMLASTTRYSASSTCAVVWYSVTTTL